MDSIVSISKQLDILFEQGSELALKFGNEQAALQEQREKEEQAEQDKPELKGQAPQEPASKKMDFENLISALVQHRAVFDEAAGPRAL